MVGWSINLSLGDTCTHFEDKRHLLGAMDASQSTVSIYQSLIDSFEVIVTAKDSSGADLTTGGELVYLKIQNP